MKIKKISAMVLLLSSVNAVMATTANEDAYKLSGIYLGGGVNVNYDKANLYNRDRLLLQNGSNIPENSKILEQTDLSYGAHILLGCGYLSSNRMFVSIEQQVGVAHHPCNKKNCIIGEKYNARSVKPWEFTTLARFGYGFQSFPGIAYASAGMKVLTLDTEDSKSVCRPVFGVGYQHGLSQHFSVRGDVLYTHISNVNYKHEGDFRAKGKGHRVSAMVTLVYTF